MNIPWTQILFIEYLFLVSRGDIVLIIDFSYLFDCEGYTNEIKAFLYFQFVIKIGLIRVQCTISIIRHIECVDVQLKRMW